MANPRQEDRSTQSMEDAAGRTTEKAAEQTSRIGQTAADQTTRTGQAAAESGEEIARASANLLQRNAETLQDACRFGLDMTTAVMGRSSDQFGRTLGLSGDGTRQAMEQSARNTQTILYTSTAAARAIGGISKEYFEFVRRQIEKNMDRMQDFWGCRTPQEVAALQTELVRETVGSALESSRRIADMSLRMADDAAKHIDKTMGEAQRAA